MLLFHACIMWLAMVAQSEQKLKRQIGSSVDENLIFSTPEIMAVFHGPDGEEQNLEAFKLKENDLIVQEMQTSPARSASLRFMSFGYPEIVMPKSREVGPKKCGIPQFVLTRKGFYFNVRTLTGQHREALASAAAHKYQRTISPSQIVMLTPNLFSCVVEITTDTGTHTLRGETKSFSTNPFKVFFDIPTDNQNVKELLNNGPLSKDMVDIRCKATKRAQSSINDQLVITSRQIDQLNLKAKLLGPADTAYVTRNQMNQLTREIQQSLHITEMYESDDGGFESSFIQTVLEIFGGNEGFKPVPFNDAIAQLSRYNINRDLNPTEIKRDLSNVLKISSVGSKQHIIANRESTGSGSSSSMDSGGGSASAGWGPFSASASASYVNTRSNSWASSSLSLDDQLREMNSHSKSDVKFEREGNMIVPKSLDVVEVSTSKLSREWNFGRIRRKLTSADYRRELYLELGDPITVTPGTSAPAITPIAPTTAAPMGASRTCNLTLELTPSKLTGRLTSIDYPNNYKNHSRCNDRVKAPPNYRVKAQFKAFHLEGNCVYDFLIISDRPINLNDTSQRRHCGSETPPNFISSGRYLFTYFETDGSVTQSGYDIRLVAVPSESSRESPEYD